MKKITPEDKMLRGIQRIYDDHPFFSVLVSKLKIISAASILTMDTDGTRIRYNPVFVDSLAIEDCFFIILHEAAHIFLGHHIRVGERDHKIYNIAADLALNDYIISNLSAESSLRDTMYFPGRGMFVDFPTGESAEFYYQKLIEMSEQDRQQKQKMMAQSSGSPDEESEEKSSQNGEEKPEDNEGSSQDGEDEESESEEDSDDNDEQDDGQDDDGDDDGQDDCQDDGSNSSDGDLFDDLKSIGEVCCDPKVQQEIDKEDSTPQSIREAMEEAEAEWEEKIQEAQVIAKTVGLGSGHAIEVSDGIIHPSVVDYKTAIRRFLTKNARSGYSYRRLSRRYGYRRDISLPARQSSLSGRIAMIVDTSGSMSLEDCDKALSEASAVLTTFPNAVVEMFQCDTRLIDESSRIFRKFDFPIKVPVEWAGRGGTNLKPAFEHIEKHVHEYQCIMVISDMEWSYNSVEDPDLPTLWVVTPGRDELYMGEPNFGQVIRLK